MSEKLSHAEVVERLNGHLAYSTDRSTAPEICPTDRTIYHSEAGAYAVALSLVRQMAAPQAGGVGEIVEHLDLISYGDSGYSDDARKLAADTASLLRSLEVQP